jgi:hypothetical protein
MQVINCIIVSEFFKIKYNRYQIIFNILIFIL